MSKVKKIIKTMLKIAGIFIAAVFLLIMVLAVRNGIMTKKDRAMVENAYGEFFVLSSGERMNYTFYDSEAQKVAVLLPGYGVSSVHYEFDTLAKRISDEYRVIIAEPLGYGLSDKTARERTTENYCDELHQLMAYLMNEKGFDRYTIIGHSISGLYAPEYTNLYPDEVASFIGIDASVPRQIQYGPDSTKPANMYKTQKMMKMLLIDTGIYRLIMDLSVNSMMDRIPTIGDAEKGKFLAMNCLDQLNETQMDEMRRFAENAQKCFDTKYPESVPVLFILSNDNCGMIPEWEQIHREVVSSPEGRIVRMDGPHELYLYNIEGLLKEIKDWKF